MHQKALPWLHDKYEMFWLIKQDQRRTVIALHIGLVILRIYLASKHMNHNAMCILKAAMNWSSLQKEGSFRQSIPTHLKSSIIWIFDRVVLLLSFAICVNSFLSIWTWFPILPYFGSFPLGILPILTFFYNFVPLRKKRFHLKY